MNSPYILFEIKPNFFQEVSIPKQSLHKWTNNENSLNNLLFKISERVYYNTDRNSHHILPGIPDNIISLNFNERLNDALEGNSPLMMIPAFGMKKSDIYEAVKYVVGAILSDNQKNPVNIKLTNDGFIDDESLRSHGFEHEITDLDISLANLFNESEKIPYENLDKIRKKLKSK